LPVDPDEKEINMPKKDLSLLSALLTLPLMAVMFAHPAPAQTKEARWEGSVIRSSKADSSLTVRKSGSDIEKTVVFDSSTKWVSQYHAAKKVNNIDPSQVKDGDYVICKGTEEKAGVLHATLISKRLSHSPE
jgi:hypothetical protein